MAFTNPLQKLIEGDEAANTLADMMQRSAGRHLHKEITIGGTGAQIANLLQLTGTVLILNQWAIITRVGTLTNMTAVYATLWDGTVSTDLTADGIVLSGAPVGSFFTKDKVAAQPYTMNLADQARMLETLDDKWAGRPFLVTQKNGVDTFIRFHSTTTDNPVDFDMEVHFEFIPMNGGDLVFL